MKVILTPPLASKSITGTKMRWEVSKKSKAIEPIEEPIKAKKRAFFKPRYLYKMPPASTMGMSAEFVVIEFLNISP